MYIRSGPCGRPRRVKEERFVFEGIFSFICSEYSVTFVRLSRNLWFSDYSVTLGRLSRKLKTKLACFSNLSCHLPLGSLLQPRDLQVVHFWIPLAPSRLICSAFLLPFASLWLPWQPQTPSSKVEFCFVLATPFARSRRIPKAPQQKLHPLL